MSKVRKHYTRNKSCCNAAELNIGSNLRCPCCGYMATRLSPQMLEDLHRERLRQTTALSWKGFGKTK